MARNTKLIIAGCSFLVVLILAYSNHFNNGFYFDDSHTIVSNNYIRDIGNIPLFFKDGSTSSSLPANQAYRPVVTTLNAIDYWIGGGLRPFYFHLSILFCYVIQAVLMFFLFRTLLNISYAHKWNQLAAFFMTAFYSLHTANAETINYVIARSDSFSTLCVVTSLFLYQIPTIRRYYLYLPTMVIGIYTKQTGVVFVPVLFLYILFFDVKAPMNGFAALDGKRKVLNALIKSAPAILLAALLFLLNQLYLTPESTVSSNTTVSRFDYLITQFYVITHYIGNFFLPVSLSADPDFKIITSITDLRVIGGIFVIMVMMVLAVFTFRNIRTRPIAFGILWFFIALAPTSSLVPLYQMANDHRTFAPYIGLVLSIGWAISLILYKYEDAITNKVIIKRLCIIVPVVIILAHAYGTYQRNKVWNSSETLWYDVTLKSPENGRGLMNYGLSQMEKGKFDVAMQYYTKALIYVPYYSFLHINMGILHNATGNPVKAEKNFKNALNYGRYNPDSYYYYGKWLYEKKKIKEAKDLLSKGLKLSPGHTKIRELLDIITLGQANNIKTGINILIGNVKRGPTAENYLELSLAYYEGGFYKECINTCLKAIALKPDYALAYNNMCCSYNQMGQYDNAIEAGKRALEIFPDFERARNNLKWAQENKSKSKQK